MQTASDQKLQDDDRRRKKDEEVRLKAEEKKRKDEDFRKKEEEEKKLNEDKKKMEEGKRKQQEDEKRKKEEEKRQKDSEKVKQNEEKKKKEVEEKRKRNMGNREKPCCRAGVCRCWYCCCIHCLLPPLLWLYGMALFGLSLYYALTYTLILKKSRQQLEPHLIFWGTVTYASLFIMLVQLTYLLVLFESINVCGRYTFGTLFILTFLLCAAVLLLSVICKDYCPFPYAKNRGTQILTTPKWRARIPFQIFVLQIATGVTMGLMIFVLHIYLHNVMQFMEETKLRDNKEDYCNCGQTKPKPDAVNPAKEVKPIPSIHTKYNTESERNNNNNYNRSYNPTIEPQRNRYQFQQPERTVQPKYSNRYNII